MFGYRFFWMFTGYSKDPDNIVWKYDDFPALADEMVEHGLYDLLHGLQSAVMVFLWMKADSQKNWAVLKTLKRI